MVGWGANSTHPDNADEDLEAMAAIRMLEVVSTTGAFSVSLDSSSHVNLYSLRISRITTVIPTGDWNI